MNIAKRFLQCYDARMPSNALLDSIRETFPAAKVGKDYFTRENLRLEKEHQFTPDNTRFAEGGCCDEINEPELLLMENHWGERFKFGGLAGYCHGGRTSLGAVSHHVPEVDGIRNLLLVAGPHIGFHEGEWGMVPRRGQPGLTTSCGALAAIVGAGREAIESKSPDPLDLQQYHVEQLLLPYLKSTGTPSIVEATQFLMERIDHDLLSMLGDLKATFDGKIAVLTGVTINTAEGNIFSPSTETVLPV